MNLRGALSKLRRLSKIYWNYLFLYIYIYYFSVDVWKVNQNSEECWHHFEEMGDKSRFLGFYVNQLWSWFIHLKLRCAFSWPKSKWTKWQQGTFNKEVRSSETNSTIQCWIQLRLREQICGDERAATSKPTRMSWRQRRMEPVLIAFRIYQRRWKWISKSWIFHHILPQGTFF